MKEHKLRIFENSMMRENIWISKRTSNNKLGKLLNEELSNSTHPKIFLG
jgi:hypothetical protein